MDANPQVFQVAAVQAAPVFLNRKATTEKACDLIAKAARNGAKLAVLPEAFIPGYPDWVWIVPNSRSDILDGLYTELIENAVTIPDKTTDLLCRTAKQSKIHVAIGVNERNAEASDASLYNSLLFIDDQGNIMGRHRKLVPTGGERLVWAQGDGNTLYAFDTPLGKLGGLICWENYMPLAQQRNVCLGDTDPCRAHLGFQRRLAVEPAAHCTRRGDVCHRVLHSDAHTRYPGSICVQDALS